MYSVQYKVIEKEDKENKQTKKTKTINKKNKNMRGAPAVGQLLAARRAALSHGCPIHGKHPFSANLYHLFQSTDKQLIHGQFCEFFDSLLF